MKTIFTISAILLSTTIISMLLNLQVLTYLCLHVSIGIIPLLVLYLVIKVCMKHKGREPLER